MAGTGASAKTARGSRLSRTRRLQQHDGPVHRRAVAVVPTPAWETPGRLAGVPGESPTFALKNRDRWGLNISNPDSKLAAPSPLLGLPKRLGRSRRWQGVSDGVVDQTAHCDGRRFADTGRRGRPTTRWACESKSRCSNSRCASPGRGCPRCTYHPPQLISLVPSPV